jgi:hypothetical protein
LRWSAARSSRSARLRAGGDPGGGVLEFAHALHDQHVAGEPGGQQGQHGGGKQADQRHHLRAARAGGHGLGRDPDRHRVVGEGRSAHAREGVQALDAVVVADHQRAPAGAVHGVAHAARHPGAEPAFGVGPARDDGAVGVGRDQHRAGRQVDVVDEGVQAGQVHRREHHGDHGAAAVDHGIGEVDGVAPDHAAEHVVAGDEAALGDRALEMAAVAQVHRVQHRHRAAADFAVQLDQAEIDVAFVTVEHVREQGIAAAGRTEQVGHAGQVDQDLARALDRLRFVGGGQVGQAPQVFLGSLDRLLALADAADDGHHGQRQDRQRDQQHQPAAQAVEAEQARPVHFRAANLSPNAITRRTPSISVATSSEM